MKSIDIVILFNGLGNQMSQYAFYLAKKKNNKSTHCLYCPDKNISQHYGFELKRVFGVSENLHFKKLFTILFSLCKYVENPTGRKKKLILRVLQTKKIKLNREPTNYSYQPQYLYLNRNNISFFQGGWHCPKYYQSMESEIKKTFKFQENKLGEDAQKILSRIRSTESISVHVRRGDYTGDVYFDNVCTPEYYSRAISIINSKTCNPYYFVFSDDIEWVKKNLNIVNAIFVSCNKGENSWGDMYLISQCKHNINANSTFSWWGAWLNSNPQKTVIVPRHFLNVDEYLDVYPETWIKI